jgi:uncharacterized protein
LTREKDTGEDTGAMTTENPEPLTESTEPAEKPPERLTPVRAQERLGSVDVLRGFAVLGILAMNIYAFAMPFPAYGNPLIGGRTSVLDLGTWWTTHVFFEMKFMSLFSALFGAGLALMAERAEARGVRFGGTYYRRLLWLLLMGAVHAYLFWFGDILFGYAICGLILYPLRRWRPHTLIAVGLILLCVMVPIALGFGFVVMLKMEVSAMEAIEAREAGEELTEKQLGEIEGWEQFNPGPEQLQDEIDAYRGGYLGQVVYRAPIVAMFQTVFLVVFGFWRICGLMLIGMGLMKLGVLSARYSTRFYACGAVIGFAVGLPVTWLGARGMFDHEFEVFYMNQGGYFPNYFGSLFLSFAYLSVVMLVFKSGILTGLTRRLAAVGRLALTNYLSHTLICTTLFYGWGFGLFDHLGRFQQMFVVLGIWILQLIVSPIWLEWFRFGPAEWLWRSLTYWRRQPMRLVVTPYRTP